MYIILDFDPQAGREQAGRRPAIVLSESEFNELTGFAVVCPITNQSKDYSFEVPIPEGLAFMGVVLKVAGSVDTESEFFKNVLRNVRSVLA